MTSAITPNIDGNVFRGRLRSGDAGVAQAIHLMKRVVMGTTYPEKGSCRNGGVFNPQIRALAVNIVSGIENRDKWAQANAIFQWVKANIEFRGEVDELIQSPLYTLKARAGDCDDHSSLLAALLMALGFQVRFRTVAADASQPKQFTHVYPEVLLNGAWTPMDTTVKSSTLGWQAPNVTRSKEWGALGSLADNLQATYNNSAPDWLNFLNSPTVSDALDPFAQAIANRIQFGQTPAYRVGSTSYQLPGQTIAGDLSGTPGASLLGAISPTTILFLGVGALALASFFKGRR